MPNTEEVIEEVIEEEEEEEEEICCDHCGDYFRESNGYDNNFCTEDCYYHYYDDESDQSIPERKWKKGDFFQFQSKEEGEIIKSKRAFSAEIEAYYRHNSDVYTIADTMPRELGISGDGSLGNNGVEFQTPKLKGKRGEQLIKDLSSGLIDSNFRVDKSCGLHVHIDGKDLLPKTRTKDNPQAIKNLLIMYITYEDFIQSILPRSRRSNRYAQHIRHNFHLKEIQECNTLEQLEKLWYRVAKRKELKRQKSEHYNSTRYNGLNLHSLFSDGHLEIRYHSGTINAAKILHWTQFHLAMVDYAKKAYNIIPNNEIATLKEKTEHLFSLLNLSEDTKNYLLMRQNTFTITEQSTEDTENRSY